MAGYLTYRYTLGLFQAEMTQSGSILVENLSTTMSNNQTQKDDFIDSIDSLLLSVGTTVINQRELITNDYLSELASAFILTDIYWYNSEGLLLNDANDEFVGWTPSIGDPIYNFMHSGLDVYVEDIRKGTEDDRYYKFVYIKAEDGYFVQVGCKADVIYQLTEAYEYQNVLDQFIEMHNELLYALVVDTNYIAIADTDEEEIGVDYTGDPVYESVLLGNTIASDWYYEKIDETVMEIATPIYDGDTVIGILAIGYSYENLNAMKKVLFSTFLSLTIFFISIFIVIVYVKMVSPLRKIGKTVEKIDINHITHRDLSKKYGSFNKLNNLLTNLINKVYDKNQENEKIINEISQIAYTDELTNLPNRSSTLKKLTEWCVEGNQVSLIYLDIDKFKNINDVKGHNYGDMVLKKIGEKLNSLSIDNIFVSRNIGDEFIITCKFINKNELNNILEKLKEIFSQKIKIDDSAVLIEFSIGVALYPIDAQTPQELLRKADMAMYEAKKINKMSYYVFDHKIEEKIKRNHQVLDALKDAILNDGFTILYQPQINIDSEEIVGLEALLRITDSNISPYEFIPIAEQNRLINKIGRIVIEKVIAQQAIWRSEGKTLVPIYVNYSPNQLYDITLMDFIKDVLAKHSLESNLLGIELTESTVIDNREETIKVLMEMKSMGIKTAIDDFGSGQAGINYLTDFKVEMVKFDKAFSDQFLKEDKLDIYYTILKLTDKLGFVVLAEGIEKKEQIDLLKSTSCRIVQGYYYYKPSKQDIIFNLLKSKK